VLHSRMERARKLHQKDESDDRLRQRYLERAMDLYSFRRLLQVCNSFGREVQRLKGIIEGTGKKELLLPTGGDRRDLN
jgi:hypothetical protein